LTAEGRGMSREGGQGQATTHDFRPMVTYAL